MTTSLPTPESNRLVELEGVISSGFKKAEKMQQKLIMVYVDVGNALKEIRDSRLYRQEYQTFKKYCRAQWMFTDRHANRLIQGGSVAQGLGPIGPIPATESQARELGRIKDPGERKKVWVEITETHKPLEITAAVIREVAKSKTPEYLHTETHEVSDAMTFVGMAISQMERIRSDDPHRMKALEKVGKWLGGEGVSLPRASNIGSPKWQQAATELEKMKAKKKEE